MMSNIYFARRTGIYGTEKDSVCKKLVLVLGLGDIVDPDILIKNRKDEIDKIESNSKKEKFIMRQICYPAIDSCNHFVYYLDGNDISWNPGVKDELAYALNKGKKIYRIYDVQKEEGDIGEDIGRGIDGDIGKSLYVYEMSESNIKNKVIQLYNDKGVRKDWALKTISDYEKFYYINKDAVELIKRQFTEGYYIKGDCAVVPHFNSAYKTYDYRKAIFGNCKEHQMRHSFYELRDKEFRITCPFTETRTVAPGYSKMKLDRFSNYDINNLLTSSRTIHRSMNIFDNSVFDKGIVLRDVIGTVVTDRGKSVADLRKVIGCIPVIDLDLSGSFFDYDIFKDCNKTLEIVRGYMDKEWPGVEWKLGFSGNGLYIIFDRLIFKKEGEENDGSTYGQWLIHWKQKREKLGKLLKIHGITNVAVEKKYGWQRYFKIMGTFHLDKDRIAIPLNKDKEMDYEWMDYYTNIRNGMKENIFKEIMNKAEENWKY
jgi:hypothetical protein